MDQLMVLVLVVIEAILDTALVYHLMELLLRLEHHMMEQILLIVIKAMSVCIGFPFLTK